MTFVLCVSNEGYEDSLERNKVYVLLSDARASRAGDYRVIDESGEDYLFEKDCFVPIALPKAAREAILRSLNTAA